MMPALTAKSVVVPVDLSPDSVASLLGASDSLARAERVRIVHVLASPGAGIDAPERQQAVDEARGMLQALISEWGMRNASAVVLEGDVGESIGRFARAVRADGILVPSRRQPGPMRFLAGPRAAQIVHHAPCPVFMIWNQSKARQGDSERRAA